MGSTDLIFFGVKACISNSRNLCNYFMSEWGKYLTRKNSYLCKRCHNLSRSSLTLFFIIFQKCQKKKMSELNDKEYDYDDIFVVVNKAYFLDLAS